MPNLINLTCPKCGGKLQITNDIDRFSCGYCGNELILQRSGGGITVAPIVEGLREVKTGVDKTASELAIVRLQGEIYNLSLQRNRITQKSSFYLSIEIVLGIDIFILFLIAIFGDWGDSGTGCFLWPGVVLFIIFVVIYYTKQNAIKQQVPAIDQMIAEKKQELEKHQNIVRNG
jgi:hypothetical protein